MDETTFNTIGTAYRSTAVTTDPTQPEEAIDPATIGMVWGFIQTLLGNCKSADRAKQMMKRPILSGANRQINNFLDAQGIVQTFDRARVKATIMKLGTDSTVEQFQSAIKSAQQEN